MFLATVFLLAPTDDLPVDDAEAAAVVLVRWEEATRGVTSVRATYRGFEYDPKLGIVKLTGGEFHQDAAAGTLLTVRPVTSERPHESGGVALRPVPGDHCRWFTNGRDGTLLKIDDDRRAYQRLPGWLSPFSHETPRPLPGEPAPLPAGPPVRPAGGGLAVLRGVAEGGRGYVCGRSRCRPHRPGRSARSCYGSAGRTERCGASSCFDPNGAGATAYLLDEVAFNPGPPPQPELNGYVDAAARSQDDLAPAAGRDRGGPGGPSWLFVLNWLVLRS